MFRMSMRMMMTISTVVADDGIGHRGRAGGTDGEYACSSSFDSGQICSTPGCVWFRIGVSGETRLTRSTPESTRFYSKSSTVSMGQTVRVSRFKSNHEVVRVDSVKLWSIVS
ncbi:hypothetical protein Hdeb2414_s0019g00542951 [Helianthus debilis subsp. tardiflorus]